MVKARAALARATGTILEENRILIEAARQGVMQARGRRQEDPAVLT